MSQQASGDAAAGECASEALGRDTAPEPVALVAVVGPFAHDLISPLVTYYSGLGVTEFRIAVHLPTGTPAMQDERLLAACERAVGPPDVVSRGRWGPGLKSLLHDRLRALAIADWHVFADADEFQFHDGGIASAIERCRGSGVPFATGLLVDRVAARGHIRAGGPTPLELDRRFPLGCFLTAQHLDGDPRKITVAHRDVRIARGHHFTSSHGQLEHPAPLPVHHFKWRAGVQEYLTQRARGFHGSVRRGEKRVGDESLAAVKLLSDELDLGPEGLSAFPASLAELPAHWENMAAPIWRYWQVDRWRARPLREAGQR